MIQRLDNRKGSWTAPPNAKGVSIIPDLGVRNSNLKLQLCSQRSTQTSYRVFFVNADGKSDSYDFTTNSPWCSQIVGNKITILDVGGDGNVGSWQVLSSCADDPFKFTLPGKGEN